MKQVLLFLCFFTVSFVFADITNEKCPVFTKDRYLACPQCKNGEYRVIHAPFHAIIDSVYAESGASLSDIDIWKDCLLNFAGSRLDYFYVEHIRKMRKTKNDSSYFSGDIEIKFWINRFGTIDDVLTIRSTTKNSLFDKVVTECIAKWKFPKSNGFSFGYIILRFKRTGYSGKSMDMEKMEYPIPGEAAS